MPRRTVPERVNEYVGKHPEAYDMLIMPDVNEISELENMLDIVCTAFAYGYMKGQKNAKKGGVTK